MFNEFLKKFDQKYLKICVYASVTVLITALIGVLALSTGSFWSKLWSIFSAILKPLIIGGIICYLLSPVVKKIENLFDRNGKKKWSRLVSVVLVFAIIAALVMLVLVMLAVSIYKNVEALDLNAIKQLYAELESEYSEIWAGVESDLSSYNISTDSLSAIVSGAASAVESFFSGLLFGVIFSIYFLFDEESKILNYWERAFHLIFGEKAKKQFLEFVGDADKAFSGYIRGQFVDAAIVGVLATAALTLAGVPYAAVVGITIGFGNLIPYFGPILGYVATVVACLPSGQIDKMVIGLVIIAVIMFVDGNIINPKLLSDNVDVHPLLVVAALLAGGAVGGIAGMLVAVPSAALIKMQFDKYLSRLEKKKESGMQH